MKLLTEVEIIDEHGITIRRQKMKAKDVFDLKEGEKILVHVNEFHQPIKVAGGVLTRFMTLLLKEPNLCPREAKNWRECKIRCGIMLLVELRRRFNLPQTENVDKALFSIFTQKFRTLKYRLKNMLFRSAANKLNEVNNIGEDGAHERQYTNDELLQALDLVGPPDGFAHHQWELFKSNLRTSAAKNLSEYGKKARHDQVHNHTTGAVSFARKKDEFKLRYKREPYQVEFFGISYENKKRKGSYVSDTTREFMDRAKLEISNKMLMFDDSEPVDIEKRSEIERNVMEELMGPGRARGHGAGVTKSQVTKFSYDLRRMRGEALTNENRALLEKVDFQSKQIEYQSKQMKIMEKKLDDCTGELRLFRTAFPHLYDDPMQVSHGASRVDIP